MSRKATLVVSHHTEVLLDCVLLALLSFTLKCSLLVMVLSCVCITTEPSLCLTSLSCVCRQEGWENVEEDYHILDQHTVDQ